MGNPIDTLSAMEAVFMTTLFAEQNRQENGVSADNLPYTAQAKWITAEMLKRFPKRRWTEKLVCRTLVRMRKAGIMDKTEKTSSKIEVPVFAPDDDIEESQGEARPPENEDGK